MAFILIFMLHLSSLRAIGSAPLAIALTIVACYCWARWSSGTSTADHELNGANVLTTVTTGEIRSH